MNTVPRFSEVACRRPTRQIEVLRRAAPTGGKGALDHLGCARRRRRGQHKGIREAHSGKVYAQVGHILLFERGNDVGGSCMQ